MQIFYVNFTKKYNNLLIYKILYNLYINQYEIYNKLIHNKIGPLIKRAYSEDMRMFF